MQSYLAIIGITIIGIIVVLLLWKIFAKTVSQPSSRPDSLPEAFKTASNPALSPSDDPHSKPSSFPETGDEAPTPVGVGWRPTSGSLSTPGASTEKQHAKPRKVAPLYSKTKIVGNVHGLSQRTAQVNQQVYSFRVETYDDQGNRLPPVTIEMKGISFEGSLNEGDQVQINKKPKHGITFKVNKLTNITAGSTFKVRKHPLFYRILSIPMTAIGLIIMVAFMAGFFLLLYRVIADLF